MAGSVGYDRLHAEPEAVEELAELCGRLPLALTLAGERASRFSELSIAGIVDDLRDQRVRLDTLRDPQDADTDLRAAFSGSYNALRPAAARMFRLLGLHPGVDIGMPAAAVLSDTPVREARELLDQLPSAHLLNQPRADRCPHPGRVVWHAEDAAAINILDQSRRCRHRPVHPALAGETDHRG